MSLRALIVDDEPLARRGLELRLKRHPDVEIVGQAANGRDGLVLALESAPDLMFLDVQMPEVDGFALLRQLPRERTPLVVFVTAYDRYALDAFAAHALDYLLKPIDDERLDAALARVRTGLEARAAAAQRDRLLGLLAQVYGRDDLPLDEALAGPPSPSDDRLALKDGARTVRVPLDEILWIDAAGDYMCVHTPATTHVARLTLRELEERLDPRRFQRIHRSAIVNLARVRELRAHSNGEYFLILDAGQTLKLSRSYKDKVRLLQ